jgi:leader peptidase (prepilin peptidase)/N-methyltransferase
VTELEFSRMWVDYPYIALALSTVIGMVLGSFNTVVVYRIPRDIPLGLFSHQRSRCSSCNKVIPWWNNIPLVSYVVLRGKCSRCGASIPMKYFWVELSTTILVVATTWIHGSTSSLTGFAFVLETLKLLFFALALVAIVFIDSEFRIIPDRFSLGTWIVAIAAAGLWTEQGFLDALLGGFFGFGMFYGLSWAYEKIKGVEGLGFGDVKMMGWLGTWVGVSAVPFVVLFASVLGLLVGVVVMQRSKAGMQTAIPFGPFLALGGWLAWMLRELGLWGLPVS